MDSLYASGEPTETKGRGEGESIDQEEAEATTAILPMKVAQGKHPDPVKEGDEIVLKVVKVYGDEVEVEYSETPASKIGKSEGYGESDANAELDKMDKGNPGGMGY